MKPSYRAYDLVTGRWLSRDLWKIVDPCPEDF
jgi:hypothetical protein